MSNLLDKASIILTPTAYNNGEALCVKPSDGSGDFDFSRNSAATRVNAQGLVENVQILSSNLVQNPSFSEEGVQEVSNGSFSQEGAELVTNGSFDTDSDWTLGTGWSISNEKLNAISVNSTSAIQNVSSFVGKSFKVTYTISDYSQGEVALYIGGNDQTLNRSENGTFTEYVTVTSGNTSLFIYGTNNFTGSIDNVSVREVAQNWTLGTGWSIGEDKATVDNTVNANLDQTCLTSGKIYKVSFEISDLLSGGILVGDIVNPGAYDATSNGSHTFYYTATNSTLRVRAYGNPCSITNISVKEVGQNWTFTNVGGSNGWRIANDRAICDAEGINNGRNINSSAALVNGKTYKLTLDILQSVDGMNVIIGGTILPNELPTGTNLGYEYYIDASQHSGGLFSIYGGSSDLQEIDNISVIEITDDTNLPRINYEGFSYQDALGSELITNGDFEDGSTGWVLSAQTSVVNGQLVIDALDGSFQFAEQNVTTTVGKNYKLQFEITEINSGGEIQFLYGYGNTVIGLTYASVGTHEIYFTPTVPNGTLQIKRKFPSNTEAVIDNVSVKEYLGQEVVPDSGCGSWLFEPQSTNLQKYSTTLSTNWIVTGSGVVTYNNAISPDGTNNATYFSAPASSSKALYNQLPISTSTYTASVWAKSKGLGNDKFQLGEGSGTGTGGVGEFTATSEWQRFTITGTTVSGGRPVGIFQPIDFSAMDILFWGYQYEEQSYATSYIPTNGEANGVTRNQDVCTNGGSLASINSTEGTLYFEGGALANDGTDRKITLSDSSLNNVIIFGYSRFSGNINAEVISGGVLQTSGFGATGVTQENNNKFALSWGGGTFKFYLNGILASSYTNVTSPIGMNVLNFSKLSGFEKMYAKTKCLAVWKEALSDEELIALTS